MKRFVLTLCFLLLFAGPLAARSEGAAPGMPWGVRMGMPRAEYMARMREATGKEPVERSGTQPALFVRGAELGGVHISLTGLFQDGEHLSGVLGAVRNSGSWGEPGEATLVEYTQKIRGLAEGLEGFLGAPRSVQLESTLIVDASGAPTRFAPPMRGTLPDVESIVRAFGRMYADAVLTLSWDRAELTCNMSCSPNTKYIGALSLAIAEGLGGEPQAVETFPMERIAALVESRAAAPEYRDPVYSLWGIEFGITEAEYRALVGDEFDGELAEMNEAGRILDSRYGTGQIAGYPVATNGYFQDRQHFTSLTLEFEPLKMGFDIDEALLMAFAERYNAAYAEIAGALSGSRPYGYVWSCIDETGVGAFSAYYAPPKAGDLLDIEQLMWRSTEPDASFELYMEIENIRLYMLVTNFMDAGWRGEMSLIVDDTNIDTTRLPVLPVMPR